MTQVTLLLNIASYLIKNKFSLKKLVLCLEREKNNLNINQQNVYEKIK